MELIVGLRFFDRIEVLALDILDERQLKLFLFRRFTNHRWNHRKASKRCGTQTALTRDQAKLSAT